jgi:plasmid stabilization system protein ParE
MLPIDYLAGARRDFDESFDWYSKRSTRTAERFADAVDAALTEVASHPKRSRFGSVDGAHQDCPVKRFPFRIVDRVVDNSILVVAIAHGRRRPRYWSDRT